MILRIYFISVILISSLAAQSFKITKIEPPNWWSGMKNNELQLMIYGENLKDIQVASKDKQFKIKKFTQTQNSSYLFVDISLTNPPAGNYELTFTKNKEKINLDYVIRKREFAPSRHQGFSNEDVVYLIMADRFCDGNPNNNKIGINHGWMKNIPFNDWINGTVENHLPPNHNKMTFPDPYSPGESIDLTWNGWFTNYMADLNQANPFLKKYLIQNAIWWTES